MAALSTIQALLAQVIVKKAARAIAAAPALRAYVKREVRPAAQAQDDAALLEFCRNRCATIFHPSGTCKMGTGPLVVLDARCGCTVSSACVSSTAPRCPRWCRATGMPLR